MTNEMSSRAIGKSLRSITKRLGRLSLQRARLSDIHLLPLTGILKLDRIASLSLRDNEITCAGVMTLVDALDGCIRLSGLDLSFNLVSSDACQLLSELGLERLNIAGNSISCDVECLVSTLQSLDLGYNIISTNGMRQVCSGLACGSLRRLVLSGNAFADQGMLSLLETLSHNPQLQELHVAECRVTDASGTALASMLEQNTQLRILNLSRNRLTDKSALLILNALDRNEILRSLNLRMNQISVEIITRVLAKLESNNQRRTSASRLVKLSRCLITLQLPYEIKCKILENYSAIYGKDRHNVHRILLSRAFIGRLAQSKFTPSSLIAAHLQNR
jgi:Leucine-rich repeat (LRR) protein